MTDVLSERLAALEETSSWDWDDVRHRARRGRLRVAVPVGAAAAAAVAAAAVAATSGWWFSTSHGFVDARLQVRLDGRPYVVVVSQAAHRIIGPSLCMSIAPAGTKVPDDFCTLDAVVAQARGEAPKSGPAPGRPLGMVLPDGGSKLIGAGQGIGRSEVWYGEAPTRTARVVVTDAAGRRHAGAAVAAPGHERIGRFWAVALDTRAVRVVALDAHGHVVERGHIERATPGRKWYGP